MKKLLLIVGIVLVIGCVLALLFAAFQLMSYYQVMDGSAALFARLRHRAAAGFAAGLFLGVLSAVCLLLRKKC